MLTELLVFLKAVPGLSALMDIDSIFSNWVYQATQPYILITTISTIPVTHKGNTTAMTVGSFQVDIYADLYETSVAISDLITTALEGKVPVNGYSFFLEDIRDFGEEEAKKFRRSVDIAVEIQST